MATHGGNSGTTVTSLIRGASPSDSPTRASRAASPARSGRVARSHGSLAPWNERQVDEMASRVPKPSAWQPATVVSIREETRRVKTIRFAVSNWPGHLAGQHADVRLTAEDGYRAERSYSIASPPEESALELTVERLDDGEVSPFLTDQLQTGDTLQLRGPIGG